MNFTLKQGGQNAMFCMKPASVVPILFSVLAIYLSLIAMLFCTDIICCIVYICIIINCNAVCFIVMLFSKSSPLLSYISNKVYEFPAFPITSDFLAGSEQNMFLFPLVLMFFWVNSTMCVLVCFTKRQSNLFFSNLFLSNLFLSNLFVL